MARYRLPAAFGAVELHSDNDREYAVDFVVDGCTVTFPRKLLVEVRPTIPDEPEPGAYRLVRPNGTYELVVRWTEEDGWDRNQDSCDTWDHIWSLYGGPDVRIVALVPRPDEAAVERAARVLYNLERSNGTDWWATAAPSERAPQLVKTEAAFRAALNGGDHD